MTTSSINHRHATYAAAATGLVSTLLAISLNSAYAVPAPDAPPTGPLSIGQAHGHSIERACFITPHTWNGALDGPLPRCYTRVH